MYKNSVLRFNEIVRVLAFYGFGYIVDTKLNNEKKSPENLRKAFEELGPTFVKIGQILSTRPDLLPQKYIDELSKLQDNVPPENFNEIDKEFTEEFGKSIEDTFMNFNRKPLACASIAQVHSAILNDGREVIVKIQRPDIAAKMMMDIEILSKIFRLTKAKFSDAVIDPEEALEELLSSTEKELNFNYEATNMEKFKELNKDVAFIHSPYLIKSLCSHKVITMEKINGIKIDNKVKLVNEGYDLKDISRKLALGYTKQILDDGFFHGDPHPGNILIRENKICFIDFGIMGSFNSSLKDSLNEAIVAVAYNDPNKLISVLMSIGIKKGYVDRNKLYEDIDYLFASYLNTSLQNIKVSVMIQEIFDTARKNNIRLPKDLTLLARGMIIIEGVIAKIDPEIKMLDVAIPFVKSNGGFNLFNSLNFDEVLINSFNFVKNSSKIPTKFIELSDSIISGRAKVQLQVNNLDKPINQLNKMANRLVFGVIVSSMIISSSLILNSNIGPKFYNISIIGITGYCIAAVMGFWLLISIMKSGNM